MKKGPKMKKYRVHSAEFKASIVNEIHAGKSLSQVARENGISPALAAQWRDKALGGEAFDDRPTVREKQLEKDLARTERKLAQLVLENDLLKKLQHDISRRTKRSSGLFVIGKKSAPKDEPQK
jgi:transposase-like protein